MQQSLTNRCDEFESKLLAAVQEVLEEGAAVCAALPEKDRKAQLFEMNVEVLSTLIITACRMAVRLGMSRLTIIFGLLRGYKHANKEVRG